MLRLPMEKQPKKRKVFICPVKKFEYTLKKFIKAVEGAAGKDIDERIDIISDKNTKAVMKTLQPIEGVMEQEAMFGCAHNEKGELCVFTKQNVGLIKHNVIQHMSSALNLDSFTSSANITVYAGDEKWEIPPFTYKDREIDEGKLREMGKSLRYATNLIKDPKGQLWLDSIDKKENAVRMRKLDALIKVAKDL